MGHGHGEHGHGEHGHGEHGHGPSVADAASASGRYRKRLTISLFIILGFLVLEVVIGLLASSLALISDAGHMLTDAIGLGMALAAIMAARRANVTAKRTFGLYRLEVLAALANAVLLFGVAGMIFVEAVRRFSEPPEVAGVPVMATAAAGLVANVVVFALLRRGAGESLNVRGAYLEVMADAVASIGVLAGGAITWLTGWNYADPIVAVAVGVFVLPRTWKLGRQALRILAQQAPDSIDVRAMERDLGALERVREVHDVHVWTLTSGMEVASAHLTTTEPADHGDVLASAQRLLAERYSIDHATLQVEPTERAARCREMSW